MKTVSQDTNIPIYAQIFTDSIAEQGKEGDSYYNMMKYNLDKIAEGLAILSRESSEVYAPDPNFVPFWNT